MSDVDWFYPEAEQKRTIAWVDNNRNRIPNLLAGSLARCNSLVATSADVDALMREPELPHVDHLFMDYDLGREDGFEQMERLLLEVPVGQAYICTAYAHLAKIEEKRVEYAKRLGRPIGLIRKENIPFIDEVEDIEDFIRALDNETFVEDSATSALSFVEGYEALPMFEEYRKLALSERVQILLMGRKLYSSLIDGHFADGVIWLLLNGETGSIIASARRVEDIWMSDDVDRYSEENKAIALSFSKGVSVDSLDNRCDPRSELEYYPVVKVELINGADVPRDASSAEFLHYDDGNSFSLMGYEYFLEKGWIGTIINPAMREQGDLVLIGKEVKLKNAEVSDAFGQTRSRPVSAFAAMNWPQYRIALRCVDICGMGCDYPPEKEHKICSRRKALLGRNLKVELDIGIATFPGTSRVKFVTMDR